ncbi:MAG: hypothetical protein LC808_34250 [Actinobacteria bacterium]|nr:hypothetical protein [Actinomycetota bacterium]
MNISWGDARTSTVNFPAGSGSTTLTLTHTYPTLDHLGRYYYKVVATATDTGQKDAAFVTHDVADMTTYGAQP